MDRSFIMLFVFYILKVLSFEKLNFVEERNNLSSSGSKFEIKQVCKDNLAG